MHNILYETYPETTTRREIEADVQYIVTHSGDRYGTDNVKFYPNQIHANYNAAVMYIDSIDKDFYGGYAVKFYDFSNVKDSTKIEELKAKIKELSEKQREYIEANSVKKRKSAYIGCAVCGSGLSRKHLKSEKCPLCGNDLRAASTLERIASFDKRIKECNEKIELERQKMKNKAKIKWLVKFEYHS